VWAPGPGPSQVDQSSWASVPLAWAPEPDHPAIDPLPPDHPGIDPPAADPWPLASVPIVPDREPGPPDLDALAPSWPHWQDLLDVPTPDVSRLRHALEAPAPSSRSRFAASRSIPEWSAEAFAVERAEDPRPSDDPWPEQDLEARRSGPELG
jgi:hypothetical protein